MLLSCSSAWMQAGCRGEDEALQRAVLPAEPSHFPCRSHHSALVAILCHPCKAAGRCVLQDQQAPTNQCLPTGQARRTQHRPPAAFSKRVQQAQRQWRPHTPPPPPPAAPPPPARRCSSRGGPSCPAAAPAPPSLQRPHHRAAARGGGRAASRPLLCPPPPRRRRPPAATALTSVIGMPSCAATRAATRSAHSGWTRAWWKAPSRQVGGGGAAGAGRREPCLHACRGMRGVGVRSSCVRAPPLSWHTLDCLPPWRRAGGHAAAQWSGPVRDRRRGHPSAI